MQRGCLLHLKAQKIGPYEEIQDEIVLLLEREGKVFHLSETESMKERFISFSVFPLFFKQKFTALNYLTLFQES